MQESQPSTESATEQSSPSGVSEPETPTLIPTPAIRNTLRPREKPPLDELGCILEFHNGPLSGQLSTSYTVEELVEKANVLNELGAVEVEIINPKRDVARDVTVLIKGTDPVLFRITLPVYVDERTAKLSEKESKIQIASR